MTTLAYYSIAALVSNNLRAIMAAGAGWVFPRVSQSGIHSSASKKLYFDLQLAIVSTGLGICLFFLLFDDIFLLWLGEDAFTNTDGYIRGFLLVLPIAAATIVPYYFITGGGYIRYNVIYRLVMSISNIALMLVLYPVLGVYGIILAYALTYAIVSSVQRSILEWHIFSERNYFGGFFILLPAIFFAGGYLMFIHYEQLAATAVMFAFSAGSIYWLYRRRAAIRLSTST